MIYVGDSIDGTGYAIFRSDTTPTEESHGSKYRYCVGPFKTVRGAEFFAEHGRSNPHIRCVDDAERIVRDIARQMGR